MKGLNFLVKIEDLYVFFLFLFLGLLIHYLGSKNLTVGARGTGIFGAYLVFLATIYVFAGNFNFLGVNLIFPSDILGLGDVPCRYSGYPDFYLKFSFSFGGISRFSKFRVIRVYLNRKIY